MQIDPLTQALFEQEFDTRLKLENILKFADDRGLIEQAFFDLPTSDETIIDHVRESIDPEGVYNFRQLLEATLQKAESSDFAQDNDSAEGIRLCILQLFLRNLLDVTDWVRDIGQAGAHEKHETSPPMLVPRMAAYAIARTITDRLKPSGLKHVREANNYYALMRG